MRGDAGEQKRAPGRSHRNSTRNRGNELGTPSVNEGFEWRRHRLSKRSPMLAACLTITMLSLAGIPPLAGFFGKFLVITAVMGHENLLWLAGIGALNVVISMYYYLCVIKKMYVSEPTSDEPILIPQGLKVALLVCVLAIMVIGVVQGPFLDMAMAATESLF